MLKRSITILTDAQIKALPTTPITVIAAQGSGFRTRILGGTAETKFAAGAYTNINTTYSTVQLDVPSGYWVMAPLCVNDNSMNTAATAVSAIFGNAQNHPIDLVNLATILGSGAASGSTEWNYPTASPGIPDVDNQVIRISMDNNGSGNLTGGNAANTLRVTLYYVAEPV